MPVVNTKLLRKEAIADGTMMFEFEKPEGLEFRAGQFADLTLIDPPETDEEGNTRGFSIVKAPYEDTIAFATRLRDTAFKRVIHDMPEGTEVKFDGPYGDYRLHNDTSKPAVFIIGGIGVTPVRSIIAQATHDKTDHKIFLFHANRSLSAAPFSEDFANFAKENPNFKFIPVVTDEVPEGFEGEEGHVNADMLKRYIDDINTPIYYLSGPEGMVKAMRKMLTDELKVDEDNIRTEEFSGY